jgi:drug/metabolite transporter (DMT)-like permease
VLLAGAALMAVPGLGAGIAVACLLSWAAANVWRRRQARLGIEVPTLRQIWADR